jgi:hypothetical protein
MQEPTAPLSLVARTEGLYKRWARMEPLLFSQEAEE